VVTTRFKTVAARVGARPARVVTLTMATTEPTQSNGQERIAREHLGSQTQFIGVDADGRGPLLELLHGDDLRRRERRRDAVRAGRDALCHAGRLVPAHGQQARLGRWPARRRLARQRPAGGPLMAQCVADVRTSARVLDAMPSVDDARMTQTDIGPTVEVTLRARNAAARVAV